ncbi:MAG TPA: substrate-binding domain-containing protein [Micromonosporaceae bacterium]|nr:substrate-binding domain-containing protein [Micromonosporaceae bacterium]
MSDTIATEPFAGEMLRGAAMYTRHARPPAVLRRHPVVMLNCLTAGARTAAVVPDELEGGRTAARALLEAGHTGHIYLIGETPPEAYAGTQRLAGIRECLSQQGTALAGSVDCLWWPEPAHAAVRQLLAEGHRPSALICLNDRVAFGAYQALREAGLDLPTDVSVISFDDSDLASWLRPQLSSIAIPHLELGRRAVELLLAEHRDGGVELVRMPLRGRASVAAPAARRGGTRASQRHPTAEG